MAEHADPPGGQVSQPTSDPLVGANGAADADPVDFETSEPVSEVESDRTGAVDDDDLAPSAQPAEAHRMSPIQAGAIIGVAVIVALAGLSGWLGYQAYQSHKAETQIQLFLQVGRQGAVNLTTIDWSHPEADVQRILDSSTGAFAEDFSARSQPFIDTVKKLQSKSVGTVTDAGIESISGDGAQVMVAMSVKTTIGTAPEQEPRSWRMRISVQKTGKDDAKVSNVAFVS